jgi:hypothetical protein
MSLPLLAYAAGLRVAEVRLPQQFTLLQLRHDVSVQRTLKVADLTIAPSYGLTRFAQCAPRPE